MFQHVSENTTTFSRSVHVIFDLNELLRVTPRLLAWGSIMSLPRTAIMEVVCHVTDVIPHGFSESDVDYPQIIDSIKDSIYYVFDDHPTAVPRPFYTDQPFQEAVCNYEADVITAGMYLRSRLSANVTYCRFASFLQEDSFLLEIDYV